MAKKTKKRVKPSKNQTRTIPVLIDSSITDSGIYFCDLFLIGEPDRDNLEPPIHNSQIVFSLTNHLRPIGAEIKKSKNLKNNVIGSSVKKIRITAIKHLGEVIHLEKGNLPKTVKLKWGSLLDFQRDKRPTVTRINGGSGKRPEK